MSLLWVQHLVVWVTVFGVFKMLKGWFVRRVNRGGLHIIEAVIDANPYRRQM
jgi:hypothetical protein